MVEVTDVSRETVPVRLTPDGRVVARILHGMPHPWVAVHGGDDGTVLEVETYSDEVAMHWRQFAIDAGMPSAWKRRAWPT